MLSSIGRTVLPEIVRKNLREYLLQTGRIEIPYTTYGLLFVSNILISVLIYILIIFPILSANPLAIVILLSLFILCLTCFILIFLTAFLLYIYYEFNIFNRSIHIENVLPDFLQEVSTNLRAGLSFDKALWNSVEPEYGIIEKEIQIVAKKVMAGEDTETALTEFSAAYRSTLLQESLDMIIVGLRSGGNITDLIDKIVENVKDASYLKKELSASVISYVIFISSIALVISPILFALSHNLMQIIGGLSNKLTSVSTYAVLFGDTGFQSIVAEDFILFSKIAIIIISTVSAIIITELREGNTHSVFKYLLLFIPVSYLVYVSMLVVLGSFFGF